MKDKKWDGSSVFVFGSNLAGIHGAGAALFARQKCGAELGVGCGMTGNSYAIPTKGKKFDVLPLGRIKNSVDDFIRYANNHPETSFFVTRIGCGLAGYSDGDIAPMFLGAPENCEIPNGWREMSKAKGS